MDFAVIIWIIFGIMDFSVIIGIIFGYCRNTFIREFFIIITTIIINLSSSFSFRHSLHELLGRIEHTRCLLAAIVTSLRLPVMFQSTLLTKIVLTARHHGALEHLPAQGALHRHVIILRADNILVIITVSSVISFLILLPLQLPSKLVV